MFEKIRQFEHNGEPNKILAKQQFKQRWYNVYEENYKLIKHVLANISLMAHH